MSPARITATLSAALALGCSATDAPTVELTNSAGKADAITLDFVLGAGEVIDLGLECAEAEGCDIALNLFSLVVEPVSVDVTLFRPDGFSRTDSAVLDTSPQGVGLGLVGFFGQETGLYTVRVANNSAVDLDLSISASWTPARPSVPIGAPCAVQADCLEGQACLGIGEEGQMGFCTSSCADLGQLRCDQGGDSYCLPIDEAGVEAFCFKACDVAAPDCGGDHLECIDVATDESDVPIGVCTVSAAVEGMGE